MQSGLRDIFRRCIFLLLFSLISLLFPLVPVYTSSATAVAENTTDAIRCLLPKGIFPYFFSHLLPLLTLLFCTDRHLIGDRQLALRSRQIGQANWPTALLRIAL